MTYAKIEYLHSICLICYSRCMIKKLLILGAILLPFLLYYLSVVVIKKSNKKIPIIPLSLVSLALLVVVLIFFRLSDDAPSKGKYIPPKFKDGKIVSPKVR